MKSILDFENQKSKTQKEFNITSMSIDQVMSQLGILLDKSEEVEGIFFLKNRSALMQDNQMAHITNFKGSNLLKEKLLDKTIKYNDFKRLKLISKNEDIAEIDILANSPAPLNFDEDKSFIISAVKEDKYNWGMLIAFAPFGKVWTKNQLKLIKSFSQLLCSALKYFHQQEKEAFFKQNNIAKENKRKLIIKKLEERLEQKNQIIAKLKKEKDNNPLSASFNWKSTPSKDNDFDEVWVTVHGYKNGEIDPVVSKWEKVNDKVLLKKVQDLFFCAPSNQASAS